MSGSSLNQLIPFEFDTTIVRTIVGDDGEPWFVARDVAAVLGYKEAGLAVRTHCKGGVKRTILTAGGDQQITVIPERDVYRLVMRSKLPTAERFEEWVVGEVLPSIRKSGSYVSKFKVPQTFSEALRLAADLSEQNEVLRTTITEQAPKVDFHDRYSKAEGNKGIREVAKLLHANEREFVAFMVASGFMYRLHGRLTPHAHHHHAGRFDVKAGVSTNDHAFNQAMFTPKGVAWIAQKWSDYQSAHA